MMLSELYMKHHFLINYSHLNYSVWNRHQCINALVEHTKSWMKRQESMKYCPIPESARLTMVTTFNSTSTTHSIPAKPHMVQQLWGSASASDCLWATLTAARLRSPAAVPLLRRGHFSLTAHNRRAVEPGKRSAVIPQLTMGAYLRRVARIRTLGKCSTIPARGEVTYRMQSCSPVQQALVGSDSRGPHGRMDSNCRPFETLTMKPLSAKTIVGFQQQV